MGIQDNFWTIGEETVAWGTKATTLTRGVENQTDYAEQLYFGPTNKNVTLAPEVSADVIDKPEEVESLVQLDWPFVIQQRSAWTDRWNKEILGQ